MGTTVALDVKALLSDYVKGNTLSEVRTHIEQTGGNVGEFERELRSFLVSRVSSGYGTLSKAIAVVVRFAGELSPNRTASEWAKVSPGKLWEEAQFPAPIKDLEWSEEQWNVIRGTIRREMRKRWEIASPTREPRTPEAKGTEAEAKGTEAKGTTSPEAVSDFLAKMKPEPLARFLESLSPEVLDKLEAALADVRTGQEMKAAA